MDTLYWLDWANLLLRWLHVITAIAWIGASFYFVWLDNHLVRPTAEDLKAKGVDGELWAVHGGGFYNAQKYRIAPKTLPVRLHWFYWESYWTWISGFALFVVLYLAQAETMLIDRSVYAWSSTWAAVAASLVYLASGWVVYDTICRVFGAREHGDLIVGVLVFLYVVLASWIACQLFSGRAAFLLTGAMLATVMSANVLMVIIPGQKKTVAAMKAGQVPDPTHPKRAKQRSVHNTYFTLPVLFAMLSNHYANAYNAPNNWLVLVLIMLAGALIRQFFIARHFGRTEWRWWIAGGGILAAVAVALSPKSAGPTAAVPVPTLAEAQAIVEARCLGCHNAQVQSKNVALHTPELLARHARTMEQQLVARLMPINNATQMTEDERARLIAWARAQR
ncbi:MAG: urate hydroxylase PuuD [Casimicrobiaceae bacterium]|nr:urate hydroxylase PuuD [Casimicrobiaceae bacterium]